MFGIPATGNGRPRLGGLEEGFEVGELVRPEKAVVLEPTIDGAEGLRVETVKAVAADALFVDEMGVAEQAEVLGDGRAGDWEGASDLSRGLMALAKEVEDGAAGGIGEGAEDGIGRMGNRVVSHNA